MNPIDPIECPICLENIAAADRAELPCVHSVHRACMERWFAQREQNQRNCCPMCRRQVEPLPPPAQAEEVEFDQGAYAQTFANLLFM